MYDIRKGWPTDAAVDEVVTAAEGATVTDGMVVTVVDDKVAPANFTGAAKPDDPMCGFLIGYELVKGTYTAIMSQCVIEVDKDHYVAGTYNPGDLLTAKDGKFAAAGSSKVLGRVISFSAASGILRLMFHEAR